MSTTIISPAEQDIDSKAFIDQRNKEVQAAKEGKPAPVVEKPKEEPAKVETKAEEPAPVKLPRSVRREMNRLREEAAEARGRLKAYEELGTKPAVPRETVTEDDPEPKQEAFGTEAEYNRALGRWEARQETKKELGKYNTEADRKAQFEQHKQHLKAMEEKMSEDIKTIPDWNEVAEKAKELDDFNTDLHPALLDAIASSDVQAYLWYYFANNPKEYDKFFKDPEPLRKDFKSEAEYTRAMQPLAASFKRLEGKVEVLYSKQLEAAQASDKSEAEKPKDEPKDRTVPETRATAADRDVRKPRPSTEVAARGGSAPPAEPEIGSKAWMDLRNQVTGGR